MLRKGQQVSVFAVTRDRKPSNDGSAEVEWKKKCRLDARPERLRQCERAGALQISTYVRSNDMSNRPVRPRRQLGNSSKSCKCSLLNLDDVFQPVSA